MISACWADRAAHVAPLGHVRELVAQHPALQGTERPEQLVVVAVARELLVEAVVVGRRGGRVGRVALHVGVDLAQPGDRVGRVGRGAADGQALEQEDHRVGLAQLELVQHGDRELAVVGLAHEAVALQEAERLADHGRVDARPRPRARTRRAPHRPEDGPSRSAPRSPHTHDRDSHAPCVHSSERRSAARDGVGSMARPTGQSARRGGDVDLNDSPEQAAYREKVRAWLAEHRAEAPAADAAATRTARHRRAPRAGRASWPRAASPASRGRRSTAARASGPIEQVIVNQEIARAGVPGDPRRDRRRHARPDDHRPRHRGAEGALPRRRCCTATRCGASCSPSPPPARTSPASRRARASRTTARWRLSGQKVWTTNAQFAVVRPAARAHRRRRAQAQGPDDVRRADGRRGRDRPRPAPDLGRGRVQRGLLRRRAASTPTPSSARSTTAGAPR